MACLVILLCALTAGFLLRRVRVPKGPGWLLSGVVALLLFFFGLSVGGDKAVEGEIARIGGEALLLGATGAAGSAAAVYVVFRLLQHYKKKK